MLLPLARDVHAIAIRDFTAAEVAMLETLLRQAIVNLERG